MEIAIAFLNNLPTSDKFDMSNFLYSDDLDGAPSEYEKIKECGFAACSVGWTPSMPGIPLPDADDDWETYGERIYDIERFSKAWNWCFDEKWSDIDNSPKGAAARMAYLLDNQELDEFSDRGYMLSIHELKRLGVYRGGV